MEKLRRRRASTSQGWVSQTKIFGVVSRALRAARMRPKLSSMYRASRPRFLIYDDFFTSEDGRDLRASEWSNKKVRAGAHNFCPSRRTHIFRIMKVHIIIFLKSLL